MLDAEMATQDWTDSYEKGGMDTGLEKVEKRGQKIEEEN